ncbi:MAG: hypothetical protein R2712_20695 [Vicinamibacterales bacterium]
MAQRLRVEPSWVLGIVIVAMRTLQQVELPDVDRMPLLPASSAGPPQSPMAAARRARDDSQGLLGFLRGRRRQWTVTFDEREPRRAFGLIDTQHLTTAAALDTRDYRGADPRCRRRRRFRCSAARARAAPAG